MAAMLALFQLSSASLASLSSLFSELLIIALLNGACFLNSASITVNATACANGRGPQLGLSVCVLSYATFGRAISHAIALSRAPSHTARDTVRDAHCHCNKNMFYVVLNDPRVESSCVASESASPSPSSSHLIALNCKSK